MAAAKRRAKARIPLPKHDVIVVGAGPAGSVVAWDLVRHGVKVLLLDRARFPREKVCGDYLEPRGLRLLDRMGCLSVLKRSQPLPITHSATYVSGKRLYRGRIPFYSVRGDMPSHGYIVPRETLDHTLLQAAAHAGAVVHEEAHVRSVTLGKTGVEVEVERGGSRTVETARLIVGADGVQSCVARSAGVLASDPRYTAVAQRAYAEGLESDLGEAAFFFDEDLFPGYGWAFPLSGGRVNLGVGILAETRERLRINVPRLFTAFFEKLRRSDRRWRKLRLCRPPIGGIVKTYGGAGPNHFHRGVLVGDAGCFVDPMTGEGISPAMDSALIAAPVLLRALHTGKTDVRSLSAYETDFRAYFDPAMGFLDLCAASLRNRHFRRSWLKALERGCAVAQEDDEFARAAGACFGGVEVNPPGILWKVWLRTGTDLARSWLPWLESGREGAPPPWTATVGASMGWCGEAWRSIVDDPLWHVGWLLDMQTKWLNLLATLRLSGADPRSQGVL